jgi:hypothetical protein
MKLCLLDLDYLYLIGKSKVLHLHFLSKLLTEKVVFEPYVLCLLDSELQGGMYTHGLLCNCRTCITFKTRDVPLPSSFFHIQQHIYKPVCVGFFSFVVFSFTIQGNLRFLALVWCFFNNRDIIQYIVHFTTVTLVALI